MSKNIGCFGAVIISFILGMFYEYVYPSQPEPVKTTEQIIQDRYNVCIKTIAIDRVHLCKEIIELKNN